MDARVALRLRKSKYLATVAGKALLAKPLAVRSQVPGRTPPVTVFVTTKNNPDALELTLRTMVATTRYPNYRVLVARDTSGPDNGSDARTQSVLADAQRQMPLTVMQEPRIQSDWYDWALSELRTDLWVAVHDDMMFLGRDWLADMVTRMQKDPAVFLIAAERPFMYENRAEPVSGKLVDMGESLPTWLFCVRQSLREHLSTSFAFAEHEAPKRTRPLCYDVGGQLLADMRERDLGYGHMPWYFRLKWHHVGNLTWIKEHGVGPQAELKRYQAADLRRRVDRMTQREVKHRRPPEG